MNDRFNGSKTEAECDKHSACYLLSLSQIASDMFNSDLILLVVGETCLQGIIPAL